MLRGFLLIAINVIGICPLFSQRINFATFKKLFSYNNEDQIKKHLKANGFYIDAERKADTDFFDTEIDAYRAIKGNEMTMEGVVILKKDGHPICLSYFTTIEAYFKLITKEAFANEFIEYKIMSDDMAIYHKRDTGLTTEKKIVEVNGKNYIRYEIGLIVNPALAITRSIIGNYTSSHNFSLEIPSTWNIVKADDIDTIRKINGRHGYYIELIGCFDTTVECDHPDLNLSFTKMDFGKESVSFKEQVDFMLSDELKKNVLESMEEKFPDKQLELNPDRPYINKEKRQLTTLTRVKSDQGNVITISSFYFLKDGTVSLVFTLNESEFYIYKENILKCIQSLKIRDGYKLEKD